MQELAPRTIAIRVILTGRDIQLTLAAGYSRATMNSARG